MKNYPYAKKWYTAPAAGFILLMFMFAACNKYIVYKTVARDPENTKKKITKSIQRHKDFVLSVHGKEYTLDSVVIDQLTGSVRGRVVQMKGTVGLYHPEDPRLAGNRSPKGKYDKAIGEDRILNQVFLVADTLIRNQDTVEIPLSSIRRIDEAHKNNAGTIGLISFGIIVVTLIVMALTADAWACFIATACYGDYNSPEVRLFRQYRDEVLLKTAAGQIFVRIYYVLSPPAARLLNRWEWGRRQVRSCILEPLARGIAAKQRCSNPIVEQPAVQTMKAASEKS